jgi:Ca2+-binding RTX toxin-like protein
MVSTACAAAVAFLLIPATAGAAPSIAEVTGNLDVGPASFGDKVKHEITVRYDAGTYRVADTAGVTAGNGCVSVDATHADCSDVVPGVVPFGGAGNDVLVVESLGPGDETGMHGFQGNDRIVGSPGVDWLVGYRGNDTLLGGGGADELLGGPADELPDEDTLDGGPGPDYISGDSSSGGIGHDTVLYSDRPASEPVRVTLNRGNGDDGGSSDGSGDTVEYVENVVGGAGNDMIEDQAGSFSITDNVFRGGAGNDVLISASNGDQLFGEEGNDKLDAGVGADRLSGGGGADELDSGTGADVLAGDAGADQLLAGKQADRLSGGAGSDLLKAEDGPDELSGDGGGDRLFGGPKKDRLTGGPGRDFMKGEGQKDLIFARDGKRDRRIDCGPGGRKEAARRDPIDPQPISC